MFEKGIVSIEAQYTYLTTQQTAKWKLPRNQTVGVMPNNYIPIMGGTEGQTDRGKTITPDFQLQGQKMDVTDFWFEIRAVEIKSMTLQNYTWYIGKRRKLESWHMLYMI